MNATIGYAGYCEAQDAPKVAQGPVGETITRITALTENLEKEIYATRDILHTALKPEQPEIALTAQANPRPCPQSELDDRLHGIENSIKHAIHMIADLRRRSTI